MFKAYKATLTLLIVAGMAAIGLILIHPPHLHTSKYAREINRLKLIPSQKTRESVDGINASDIDSIEFTGVDMSTNTITVTDPALISQFLEALRYAYTSGTNNYTNRSELMQIKLSAQKGSRWLSYYFTPYRVSDNYGPQFRDALFGLSGFEAKQVHEDAEANASNIRAVDFHFKTVTKPDDIHKIVSALSQLNERDFDYAAPDASMFDMTLQIKNGKAIEVCLHTSSGKQLPIELQSYFAQAQQAK